EINKEGFVRNERLLLPDPVDGFGRHVVHQVVALFGGLLNLDRDSSFIERGIPLVRLASNKSVEIFESASSGRPCIKWARRTGLPNRNFVALAELRRGVTVEL